MYRNILVFILLMIGLSAAWAADFNLPDLSGKTVKLSDYRGKVVILNFWTTWCPACLEEMPALQKLYQKFKDRGLVVLAVALGAEPRDVKRIKAKYKLDFTFLIDAQADAARDYRVTFVPVSFIFDKHGRQVKRYLGKVDWLDGMIIKSIENLLKTRYYI